MSERWKAERTSGTDVEPDLLDVISRTCSAIMGEYTCKEIIEGIMAAYALPADVIPEPPARTFIPAWYADALMHSLLDGLSQIPAWKAHTARVRAHRTNYKRKMKQYRAAFRRRKRGLA